MFQENNKAIYLQIAERVHDDVLSGALRPGQRLPSVREYAAAVQVNPNTVMRTYELLSRDGIIVNRRGIGFFLTDEAPDIIRDLRVARLMDTELPALFRRLALLGVTPAELSASYNKYLSSFTSNDSYQQSHEQ